MRSGWNSSRSSGFSPTPTKRIGTLATVADRQRRAAAGVAVELGEEDPGERQRRGEGAGALHRVLAGHRVGDEERSRCGSSRVGEPAHLGHQLLVDVEPAGGVDRSARRGRGRARLEGARRERLDRARPASGASTGTPTRAPTCTSCSTAAARWRSRRDQQRVAAALLQPPGELAGGGGLARALQAAEQHDRRAAVEPQLGRPPRRAAPTSSSRTILTTCWRRRRLARTSSPAERSRHPLDEVLDHPEMDVGLEQRQPDLPQRLVQGASE